MANQNFTQMLAETRRKSRLGGMDVPTNVRRGIVEGDAANAGNRNDTRRSLDLQERNIDLQERTVDRQLEAANDTASRSREFDRESQLMNLSHQKELASNQRTWDSERLGIQQSFDQKLQDQRMGADKEIQASNLALERERIRSNEKNANRQADASGGGGTWLCGATKDNAGLSVPELMAIGRLRRWFRDNDDTAFGWYFDTGPALLEGISEKEDDLEKFYTDLKEKLVVPIVEKVREKDMGGAAQHYIDTVVDLVREYLPDRLSDGEEMLKCR